METSRSLQECLSAAPTKLMGRRLIFDEAWLASRFSGTESLLRIYAEADQPDKVKALLDAAVEYLGV